MKTEETNPQVNDSNLSNCSNISQNSRVSQNTGNNSNHLNGAIKEKKYSSELNDSLTSSNSSFFLHNKRTRPSSRLKENIQTLANLKSNGKKKFINDYFKTTGLVSSHGLPNTSSSNPSIDILQPETLIKEIKAKDTEIQFLKEEISKLKTHIENNDKKFNDEKIKTNSLISKLLLEKEELQRNDKKKQLFETQKKIGKISLVRTARGQYIDIWEDGEELSTVKKRLTSIKEQKDKNINQLGDNKDKYSFENFVLDKEKVFLEEKLKYLEKEKSSHLFEIQLLTEEKNCSYNNSWPLLNKRYQTLSLLGKGGFSEVYKAFDLEEKQYVACKIYTIKNNWSKEICENYLKHTIREIEIHKKINCDQIVKQLNVFNIDNNSFCTVLEYCNCGDLNTYMNLNKHFSEKEIQCIVKQILDGLDYLSKMKNKVIHYDLKPQNILFHNNQVKISDFGVSKVVDDVSGNNSNIELTSQGTGTYYYLPPECFEIGKNVLINNKVDIWSVGVICFEMIYGKKPFGHGCSQEKLFDIMSCTNKTILPSEPKISVELEEFINGCLEFNIYKRFSVQDALESKFIRREAE